MIAHKLPYNETQEYAVKRTPVFMAYEIISVEYGFIVLRNS